MDSVEVIPGGRRKAKGITIPRQSPAVGHSIHLVQAPVLSLEQIACETDLQAIGGYLAICAQAADGGIDGMQVP